MFFKKKSLQDYLEGEKRLRVCGIVFKIKKIDATSHLQGINALQKIYDVYKTKKEKTEKPEFLDSIDKVKKIYQEILLAGVVEPTLSAKEDTQDVYVGNLLKDLYISRKLVEAILKYTYKKKVGRLI